MSRGGALVAQAQRVRELAAEVDALLTPELCSLMYTRGAALLGSAERDRLVRTLKPLAALRFRLGASAGLSLAEQPSGSLEAFFLSTEYEVFAVKAAPLSTHLLIKSSSLSFSITRDGYTRASSATSSSA